MTPIVSLIKETGLESMSSSLQDISDYCQLMQTTLKKYPAAKKYIGPVVCTSGSGYAVDVHQSYGLTFEGMRYILKLLGSKTRVADSLELLKEAIPKTDGQVAIATSASLLANHDVEFSKHAVSLFVQKEKDLFFVTLNDSTGKGTLADDVSKALFKDAKAVICPSVVKRQQEGESTCNAFVITDCLAFEQDPRLLETIVRVNNLSKTRLGQTIKTLPPSMMTLQSPLAARAKALEYQGMILKRVIAGKSLKETSAKINARSLCTLILLGLLLGNVCVANSGSAISLILS